MYIYGLCVSVGRSVCMPVCIPVYLPSVGLSVCVPVCTSAYGLFSHDVYFLQAEYAASRGLGGVAVFSLDSDDFTGTVCGQGKYPLLTTVYTVLPAPSETRRRRRKEKKGVGGGELL